MKQFGNLPLFVAISFRDRVITPASSRQHKTSTTPRTNESCMFWYLPEILWKVFFLVVINSPDMVSGCGKINKIPILACLLGDSRCYIVFCARSSGSIVLALRQDTYLNSVTRREKGGIGYSAIRTRDVSWRSACNRNCLPEATLCPPSSERITIQHKEPKHVSLVESSNLYTSLDCCHPRHRSIRSRKLQH